MWDWTPTGVRCFIFIISINYSTYSKVDVGFRPDINPSGGSGQDDDGEDELQNRRRDEDYELYFAIKYSPVLTSIMRSTKAAFLPPVPAVILKISFSKQEIYFRIRVVRKRNNCRLNWVEGNVKGEYHAGLRPITEAA